MTIRFVLTTVLVTVVSGNAGICEQSASGRPTGEDDEQLSRSQVETIQQQWVRAYQQGHVQQLIDQIRMQLPRLDREKIHAINRLLASHDVPAIDQIFAEARLPEVMHGTTGPSPINSPTELVQTLRGMSEYVDRIVDRVKNHAVMQDPLVGPRTFDAYERLFWEIHVMANRLTNAQQMAVFADRLSTVSQRRVRRDRLDEKQLAWVDKDFSALAANVEHIRNQLHERTVELRVYRIEDAYETLGDSSDPKQRLLAAYVMDTEGNQIQQFFKSVRDNENYRFQREGLNDEQMEQSIAELVSEVRKSSGVTIEKGRLLMAGLHWWMRGRYGAGPEYYGLFKSRQASRDPAVRFALYMPIGRPRPSDPFDADKARVPQYDRRHHYTWSYQDRQINVSRQTGRSNYQTQELLEVNKTAEPVFW